MPALTNVLRVSFSLDFECGQPEEIYHLVESWENCKGNADIFHNYFLTVSCVVTSVEQGHNYNGLEKVQYRCNFLLEKMCGDSLKLIFACRRR